MTITFKTFLKESEEDLQKFTTFISILFGARDQAHELHLSTSSFAEHSTLDELYDLLLDHTDELAEMFQGKFGKLPLKAVSDVVQGDDAKTFINNLVDWVEKARQDLLGDNQIIIAKYEELVGDLYRIKYKIENLA